MLTKKKRGPTTKKIKKKAWDVFSKYIRTRDTTKLGTQCYTCYKYFPIERTQAGHYQDGRHPVYLFDERQVHAQCFACNVFLHGNKLEYNDHMIKDYGEEEVKEMRAHKKDLKQFKVYELEEIYLKYKGKLQKELESRM